MGSLVFAATNPTPTDECLVEWTDSFMRDRQVIMSVDGQDSAPLEVITGLPQGSPISPVLFAIYIADIHQAVESQIEDCRGISFVDDITWVAESGPRRRGTKTRGLRGRQPPVGRGQCSPLRDLQDGGSSVLQKAPT